MSLRNLEEAFMGGRVFHVLLSRFTSLSCSKQAWLFLFLKQMVPGLGLLQQFFLAGCLLVPTLFPTFCENLDMFNFFVPECLPLLKEKNNIPYLH